MQVDLNNIPYSLISGAVAFVSSYAVVRYQINNLKQSVLELKKTVDKNELEVKNEIKEVDIKREQLKDMVHSIDKKVTEIHAVITKN
jgi:hypothetical protein